MTFVIWHFEKYLLTGRYCSYRGLEIFFCEIILYNCPKQLWLSYAVIVRYFWNEVKTVGMKSVGLLKAGKQLNIILVIIIVIIVACHHHYQRHKCKVFWKLALREIFKKLNTYILWHQTRRGGAGSERVKKRHKGFKKIILGPPKHVLHLVCIYFGHIYSY